jgi:hypothetical protein
MNAYAPPCNPPYVLHSRLAAFVYHRLFQLPTQAIQKQPEGHYWSLEGAATLPGVTGTAGIGSEAVLDALLRLMNQITESNGQRATQLRGEARTIQAQASELHGKLEFTIASKKLRKRCDMVPFS